MSAGAVAELADRVERDVARRTTDHLSQEAVEGLDVVYHALVFTGAPDALEHWRHALWSGAVSPEARRSVEAMLEHLLAANSRGETDAAARICDCLEPLVEAAGGRRD